jgi:tetratricopeptide (TPR) repeat protein
MTKATRKLTQQVTDLREAGRQQQALALAGRLILRFAKETDYLGLFDVLGSRCLVWKHLFQLTRRKVYRFLMRSDAELGLALSITEKLKSRLHVAHFRMAETLMTFQDYKVAAREYQLALRHYRGNRAERGDFRYHLGEALYRSGKRELGKKTILQGLQEIQANRDAVDSFLANVWESGAYMRIAELLWKSKPKKAKQYLGEAKRIIESDKLLVMRRKQFQILLLELQD